MANGETSILEERNKQLVDVRLEVQSLIAGLQRSDPRLYDAITLLNRQLGEVTEGMIPLLRRSQEIAKGISSLPAPGSFTAFTTGTTVRFTWDHVSYASHYEVRQGINWDTASFLFRTTGLQGDIDPLLYGDYTFLIKTVDSDGLYSATSSSTTFGVHDIAAPAVSASVIDNNVLLSWTEPPSTFKIDYYTVGREGGTTGKVDGTFTTLFEVVAGYYEYFVTAVDIAGNVGTGALIGVAVSTPPDYALQDTRVSGLNGERYNVIRIPLRPSLLACVPTPQTWEQHFQIRTWLDPEDQVSAGYPIYIQPTEVTGWYREIIDYGTVIRNVIITITWNTIVHVEQTNIVVGMRYATTETGGVPNWTAPRTYGSSQYFPEIRWLELNLDFTSDSDKALLEIYNLTISMAAKRENDGGEIFADASHVGGTQVNFTKSFRDIESITCTTKSVTEPFVTIFDFTDIPDPVGFKVFVFDTMGARVSKIVDWKARGIV